MTKIKVLLGMPFQGGFQNPVREVSIIEPTLEMGDETVLTAGAALAEKTDSDICWDAPFNPCPVPARFVVNIRNDTDVVPSGDAADGGPTDARL
jgi:hypothetical protein